MGYALIVADVRRGIFDERNLDSIGISNLLGLDPYLIIPKGEYLFDRGYFKKILRVELDEEEFLNPLNMVEVLKVTFETTGHPSYVIFSNGSSGMEIAPYVAGTFRVPIITDVCGYEPEKGLIYRGFYSEKVHGIFRFRDSSFYVITVRSGSFRERATPYPLKASEETIKILTPKKEREFLGYFEEEKGDVDITRADFLLSIGRGVGSKDEIPSYEELASLLGATLSASRPVVDKQWLPKARQVGTSGKTVKPKVYLAMGISGAFQHVSGMKDSECIIAVNKDPEAPIFQYAHYGIIADMHKLRDRIKEILKGSSGGG